MEKSFDDYPQRNIKARKQSQFDNVSETKDEEDELSKKGKMCEEELTLEEEKIKEKKMKVILKMEGVQPNLEGKLGYPHKITFGYLRNYDQGKVTENKYSTKKEENCLADEGNNWKTIDIPFTIVHNCLSSSLNQSSGLFFSFWCFFSNLNLSIACKSYMFIAIIIGL